MKGAGARPLPYQTMPTQFFEDGIKAGLRERRRLSAFLDALVKAETGGVKPPRIACIFCTDEALLEKNMQFLAHDTYTDIITFDTTEEDGRLSGELHISVDRVRENAESFGVTTDEELHRVIFHGVLHLCGYGDKTKKDIEQMRAAETRCLQAYFEKGSHS
jgi:rRNA maturation RNase YbeY